MTLLGDIQARAVDDGASVASLLRRCLLLANRLSYPPLEEWAAQELEGYPADAELPSYRLARSGAYGNFLGLGHMQRRGVTIPAGALPAAHRRFAESLFLRDGVAAYESILPQARAGELRVPWPGDLTLSQQTSLLEGWILTDAFQVVPPGVIPGLLDALRTKVLKFAMELERLSPSAGESPPDETPIPEAALATVFNTVIIGDQANVAIGSPSSSLSQGVTPEIFSRCSQRFGNSAFRKLTLRSSLPRSNQSRRSQGRRFMVGVADSHRRRRPELWSLERQS